MKRGTPTHLKTSRVGRRLGLPKYGAVGVLECLWHLTAENALAGNIGRHANEEIAIAVDWESEPDDLISALVECGWLDEHPEHRLLVHDWPQHCEDGVHLELARAREYFADGSEPKLTRLSAKERESIERFYTSARQAHDVRTASALPSRSDPSPSEPDQADPQRAYETRTSNPSADPLVGAVLLVSGDAFTHAEWWAETVSLVRAGGQEHTFEDAIRYAQGCADPYMRKLKDLGELEKPGAWIAGELKKVGIQLPRHLMVTEQLYN